MKQSRKDSLWALLGLCYYFGGTGMILGAILSLGRGELRSFGVQLFLAPTLILACRGAATMCSSSCWVKTTTEDLEK